MLFLFIQSNSTSLHSITKILISFCDSLDITDSNFGQFIETVAVKHVSDQQTAALQMMTLCNIVCHGGKISC